MTTRRAPIVIVVAVATACTGAPRRSTSPAAAEAGPGWGPAQCPKPASEAQSPGQQRGDRLASVVVKDCEGRDVSLDRFCGADALWIFAAHGWCRHCRAVTGNAEAIMAPYAGRNVAAVNVLVENTDGQAPTEADCKAWARTYALGKNVVPLYDPSGVALMKLWDGPTTALSVFVDKDRVIIGKTHLDDPDVLRAGIDVALARR